MKLTCFRFLCLIALTSSTGSALTTPEELAAHTVRRRRAWHYLWSHLGTAVALLLVASGSGFMAHMGAWAFIPIALFAVPSALLGVPRPRDRRL